MTRTWMTTESPLSLFVLEVGELPTEELVAIATRARARGRRVIFLGLGGRSVSELLQIAFAGGHWEGRLPG